MNPVFVANFRRSLMAWAQTLPTVALTIIADIRGRAPCMHVSMWDIMDEAEHLARFMFGNRN